MKGDILIVAVETDGIVFCFIGNVKFSREIISQNFWIKRTMCLMARGAVILHNRPMKKLTGFDLFAQIFMTGEANVLEGRLEELLKVGEMDPVA